MGRTQGTRPFTIAPSCRVGNPVRVFWKTTPLRRWPSHRPDVSVAEGSSPYFTVHTTMPGNWQHSELLPSQENKFVLRILTQGYVDFSCLCNFQPFSRVGHFCPVLFCNLFWVRHNILTMPSVYDQLVIWSRKLYRECGRISLPFPISEGIPNNTREK